MKAAVAIRWNTLAFGGSILIGLCLPALLWAAPAASRQPAPSLVIAPTIPHVIDGIQGLKLGMDGDDARAVLKSLGVPADVKGDQGKDVDKDVDKDKDEDSDDGHQEVWRLHGTPFSQIAFATGDDGAVLWVTGFVRPGQEISFTSLGDLSQASGHTTNRVLWTVVRPHNLYRVMAGGKDGKASIISLLSLHPANPNGIFSLAVKPHKKTGETK